jgi:hypothetical protein
VNLAERTRHLTTIVGPPAKTPTGDSAILILLTARSAEDLGPPI